MSRPSPSSQPGKRRAAARSPRRGFSLIEILVVIGLIAFLTAAIVAVVPPVTHAREYRCDSGHDQESRRDAE